MEIEITQRGDHALARLVGVLDESARECFDEQLHPLIAQPGTRLLIDLSGSERITSAGVGLLVTLVSRANTKDSHIVLASATPFVNSIFRATKLTKFFDIADTLESGLELLRSS